MAPLLCVLLLGGCTGNDHDGLQNPNVTPVAATEPSESPSATPGMGQANRTALKQYAREMRPLFQSMDAGESPEWLALDAYLEIDVPPALVSIHAALVRSAQTHTAVGVLARALGSIEEARLRAKDTGYAPPHCVNAQLPEAQEWSTSMREVCVVRSLTSEAWLRTRIAWEVALGLACGLSEAELYPSSAVARCAGN